MKIAFVSSAESHHVIKLSEGLVKKGHQVDVYTNADRIGKVNQFDKRVKVHFLKYSGRLGYYLNAIQLRRILKNEQYDVVNAHYISGYGLLARLSKATPLLLSVFGSDVYKFPYKGLLQKWMVQKNLKYAKGIASTSYSMIEQIKKFNDTHDEIFVTPFGVDLNKFRKLDEISKRDSFRIVIMKKLEPIYGIEYLIKAIKIVKEDLILKGSDVKLELCIYGDGKLKSELVDITKQFKLEEEVIFCGYIPNNEVPKVLNNCDLVCLSSISESFGVSAIEAMACEVPVIATDTPGFSEVIEDNITGFIVPIKDEEKMAKRIIDMINMTYNERREIGLRGRKRVEELYNFEENIKELEKALIYTKNKVDKG